MADSLCDGCDSTPPELYEKAGKQIKEEFLAAGEVTDLRPWMTRALQIVIELRRDDETRST